MKSALLLALALLPAISFADAPSDLLKIEDEMSACLDAPENQNTMGMKMCVNRAREQADQLLNRVYKQITSELKAENSNESKESLRRLIAAQRAWIAYRDTNSELAGTNSLGGSLEGLEILSKSYEMTKARVTELNDLFNGTLE